MAEINEQRLKELSNLFDRILTPRDVEDVDLKPRRRRPRRSLVNKDVNKGAVVNNVNNGADNNVKTGAVVNNPNVDREESGVNTTGASVNVTGLQQHCVNVEKTNAQGLGLKNTNAVGAKSVWEETCVNAFQLQQKNKLLTAAENGQTENVQHLISTGVDVNSVNSKGLTALMLATQHGHSECVKILILSGADVNQTDATGDVCLVQESNVTTGHDLCIAEILKAGLDVNCRDFRGFTALMIETMAGHEKCVKILLSSGANVNAVAKYGESALSLAIRKSYENILNILLEAGASVKTEEVATLFLNMASQGKNVLMKLMLDSGANVKFADRDGNTALNNATRSGYECCVNILLQAGADVNKQNIVKMQAPLHLAVLCNHIGIVSKLIQAGCDVNISDEEGDTPLMLASQKGFYECVYALLEAGADVNSVNKNGCHALMFAARGGQKDCIPLLLDSGSDVNAVNYKGETALMMVANFWNPNRQCLYDLLMAGALINMSNSRNENALTRHLSRIFPQREIVMFLFAAGEAINTLNKPKLGEPPNPEIQIPNYLQVKNTGLELKMFCRDTIRGSMLKTNPHLNLFHRVSQLGLPPPLVRFLLYDASLDAFKAESVVQQC